MNVSIAVASARARTLGARRRLCRAALLVCLPAGAFLAAHAAGDGNGAAARPPTFENRSISLPRAPVSIPALPAFGTLPELRVPPPVLPALPIAPPAPADPPPGSPRPSAVPPHTPPAPPAPPDDEGEDDEQFESTPAPAPGDPAATPEPEPAEPAPAEPPSADPGPAAPAAAPAPRPRRFRHSPA